MQLCSAGSDADTAGDSSEEHSRTRKLRIGIKRPYLFLGWDSGSWIPQPDPTHPSPPPPGPLPLPLYAFTTPLLSNASNKSARTPCQMRTRSVGRTVPPPHTLHPPHHHHHHRHYLLLCQVQSARLIPPQRAGGTRNALEPGRAEAGVMKKKAPLGH